eukprot:Gb_30169 [translate_table: standard]
MTAAMPAIMHPFHRPFLSLLLILLSSLFFSFQSSPDDISHTTFIFNKFNFSSKLHLTKGASVTSNVLRLTNHSHWLIGRAFYSTPVQIKNNNTVLSFSTTFVFSMVPPAGQGPGGHGIAFIMTPSKSSRLTGALPAEYFGLVNISSNGQPYNHLFAVEFDTNQSVEFEDIDANHVGVDLNSLKSVASDTAGYWANEKEFKKLSLKSGQNIQVWIDYDNLQKQINVTITLAGLPRPQKPLISRNNIQLSNVLEDQMYVGFSSATGILVEDHYILAWSFNTNGMAPSLDLSHLPLFIPPKSKYRSTRFIAGVAVLFSLVLVVGILAVFMWFKRMQGREIIEDWELEFWPHRFLYKDLSIATKGFREEQVLGCGGFGRVYRGVIPSSGLEVAVKCITKEVTEGMKDFIAEITSMGRLQHRNLVQLRGWCRNKKQLFIVYDYMANGSLDRMIFGNPKTVLPWCQRYNILKGIAAGLLYLHQQWEKRVVHRDIKSSNVLLDSDMNGRLGDFGLARLYDHSENPQTTHIVGTLGYIAPELIQTGKATPSTDVFSFGVVLLEVACGRKPVDPSKEPEQVVLVEWVWELYAEGRVMDAVDARLCNEYDVEEMEKVLHLGLFCSHPQPEGRLSARKVLQILEGEAPLPLLAVPSSIMSSPYFHYRDTMSYSSSSKSSHSKFNKNSQEGKIER